MGYVTIKEANESRLHFMREPTNRSWAILIGLLSLGLGAAYYSGDYVWWKIAYLSGSVFVGLTCMEDWEECILDKETKKVTIKRQTLIQKLFQATEGQKIVVADLEDIISVTIQDEEVKYGGTGHIVVLNFGAGYSLGLTETTTVEGDTSEQEYIVEKINNFLQLDPKESSSVPLARFTIPGKINDTTETQEAGAAEASPMATEHIDDITTETGGPATLLAQTPSSTDDSDDSFEQIDKAELITFNETETETVSPSAEQKDEADKVMEASAADEDQ